MDKLPVEQQQQLKKMSDERLRQKLCASDFPEQVVAAWGREELLDRFAGVVAAGAKPKEGAAVVTPEPEEEAFADPEPQAEIVVADTEVEKQRLAFEVRKWEQQFQLEKWKREQEVELEKQRIEQENQRLEQEKQQREQEREQEKQKREQEREQEKQRLDFEKQKAEYEREKWKAEREDKIRREEVEQKRREEDIKRQDAKEKKADEKKNDAATRAKKYGEAIRGSIIPMGVDALDAIVFFKRAEQLFVDYEIPKEFQSKVISPFLSAKAKVVLSKLTPETTAVYDDMKAAILRELKLSASTYLERFNTCCKAGDETYVSYASKLRCLLDYYLDSRDVTEFEKLCELLVCDRIKSTLSENCLKYILSVESSKEAGNWLPVKELTTSIDKFVAAKGDAIKPRAYAIGQTPQKNPKFDGVGGYRPMKSPQLPVVTKQSSSKEAGNYQSTPVKPRGCFNCGMQGHYAKECPKRPTVVPRASIRQVAVTGECTLGATAKPRVSQQAKPAKPIDNAGSAVSVNETSSGPGVNRVGIVVPAVTSNASEVLIDRDESPIVMTKQCDLNETVAMCCPVSQLSSLTYVDVIVKQNDDDDGILVRAMADTGAQVSVIRENLLEDLKPEILGKIRLQPFCGSAVEADWVKLKLLPGHGGNNKPLEINCAVVHDLVEQMLITADVMSYLSRCDNDVVVASNVVDNDDDSCNDNVDADDNDVTDDGCINVDDVGSVLSDYHNDSGVVDSPTSLDNDSDETDFVSCEQLEKEQKQDETLKGCFKLAALGKGQFKIKDGLLYHTQTILNREHEQLVVPQSRRNNVLELGHAVHGGHMGSKRTKQRIELTFYWPTLNSECKQFVKTCGVCQLKRRKTKNDRVPIEPIPRSDRVFDHLFVDCCGPFVSGEGAKPKFNYAFIAVDSFSRFPFCTPLRSLHAKNVCDALLDIWQYTGTSSYLSSDLGTNFTSRLTKEFEKRLGCSPRYNSPFHPNSTGLAERSVGNVKTIVSKLAMDKPNQWDRYVPSVMWALREAVNATTGLSPWELVFGHTPRGPLNILKNHWLGNEKLPGFVSFGKSAASYLQDVQKRLEIANEYATVHTEKEQERYKKYYNLRSADKKFSVGDQVLVLIPDNTASKLFSNWTGPATVIGVRSPYSYDVEVDGVRKTYHANHLRRYYVRVESVVFDPSVYRFSDDCDNSPTLSGDLTELEINSCAVVYENDDDFGHVEPVPVSFDRSHDCVLPSAKIDYETIKHLEQSQQAELLDLLDQYPECFSDIPGFSDVITHSIYLLDGFRPKRMPAYRVPEKLKPEVKRQINEMLKNKIIRPSLSPMASPLVCVLKGRDGCDGVRLAVDYRYVNKYSLDDAFPMPDLSSIIQNVSKSTVISVTDFKAGYWQLPCAEKDKWLTAFVCDEGIFEFNRVPFGLKNSGTCFVRAVAQILKPVNDITKSFVDDIAVHSSHWRMHMVDLRKFLETVKQSGLTINLKKCKWGHKQVKYCGKIIGSNKILPDPDKISVVETMNPPKSRKDLRRVLGFFNHFRDHIPRYAEIAKPLTDLTKKRCQKNFPWGEAQEEAFSKLKVLLVKATEKPLYAVDFNKPFCLYTDANQFTVSAALCQMSDAGVQLPVAFSSTKLTETQRRWSVIEKEAFSVLVALRKYRGWLFSNFVTIWSDHNPLSFLTESTPKSAKLMRWALSLQEFNISFKFCPGEKNVVADCLSRLEN